MLLLPEDKRTLFKAPFGVVYSNIEEVLGKIAGKTIYSVGDVVTFHLSLAGIVPAIAVIDGYTMREPFNFLPKGYKRSYTAKNPPGSLTNELTRVLHQAIEEPGVLVVVDGEEDLAVLPLVMEAPLGTAVLYGQPGEGIVLCEVTAKAKQKARELLSHFVETNDQ
jgi:uncharacterized protein (UPF0218 family)